MSLRIIQNRRKQVGILTVDDLERFWRCNHPENYMYQKEALTTHYESDCI